MSKDDESESESNFENSLPDGNNKNILEQIDQLISNNAEVIEKVGSLDNALFNDLIQRSTKTRRRKYYERMLKNGSFLVIVLVLIGTVAYFTFEGIISGQTFTLFIGSILGYIAKLHSENSSN